MNFFKFSFFVTVFVSSSFLTGCLLLPPLQNNTVQESSSLNVTSESGHDYLCDAFFKLTAEKNSSYAENEFLGKVMEVKGEIISINTDSTNSYFAIVALKSGKQLFSFYDLFGTSESWRIGETRTVKGVVTMIKKNINDPNNYKCNTFLNDPTLIRIKRGQCTMRKGNYNRDIQICLPSHELSPM